MQEHVYVVKNIDSKDSRLLFLLFFICVLMIGNMY